MASATSDALPPTPEYTYAGVMAWFEGEWRRFHREREEWCTEKAILCCSVDNLRRLLRTAQANENALQRRIQALESQLRQEGKPLPPPLPAGGNGDAGVSGAEEPASLQALRLPSGAVQAGGSVDMTPPIQIGGATPPDEAAEAGESMASLGARWEVGSTSSQMSAIHHPSAAGSPVSSGASTPAAQPINPGAGAVPPAADRKPGKTPVSVNVKAAAAAAAAQLNPAEAAPPSPQAAALQPTRIPPQTTASSSQISKSWELRVYIRGHFAAIRCGCWCGDGTLMLTGGDDHVIKLWDARRVLKGKEREEPIMTFRGHSSPVIAVASSGEEVIAAAWDGSIRVWKVPPQSGQGHASFASAPDGDNTGSIALTSHTDAVWGLAVAPAPAGGAADAGSLTFASVGADGQMILWRRHGSSFLPAVRFFPTDAMTPDASSAKGAAFVPIHCKLSATRFHVTYALPTHGTYGVAVYSLHGQLLWHRPIASRPTSLGLNPRGTLLGIGTLDGKLEVYEVADNNTAQTLLSASPHTSPITSIDFAQDVVFTSGHDGKVAALAVSSASVIQYLPSPHTPRLGECVHVVLYHTGRGIVVTAGADCSIAWFTSTQSK